MSEKLTHWKTYSDSPYLGAYSLQPGEELQLTIAKAVAEKVVGTDGATEIVRVVHFEEKGVKPMIVNATNAKIISKLAGSPYMEKWAGVTVQIYADKVKAFGEVVEALRIRPHKVKPKATPKCSDCGKDITAAYGKSPVELSEYTKSRFGVTLCGTCAEKRVTAKSE